MKLIYFYIILLNFVAFNSSSLDVKLVVMEYSPEPTNIKYIAFLKKKMTRVCIGCLVSSRHILSAGGCIYLLSKHANDKPKYFEATASIDRNDYKIIKAVHHPGFTPKRGWNRRYNDVGIALVCL